MIKKDVHAILAFLCIPLLWTLVSSWTHSTKTRYILCVDILPGGYFQIRRSGGLDLIASLEANFEARSGHFHQTRRKAWEVLSPQDAKLGKKSPFWGHIWNSQGDIWGNCHQYFWRQNLGLQQEFQRQFLGPSPPRPPNMEVPLGIFSKWLCQP